MLFDIPSGARSLLLVELFFVRKGRGETFIKQNYDDDAMAHFEVPEFRIKFSDVFSLRNLYIMLRQTLLEEGWYGADNDKEGADLETFYSENVFQKGIHKGGKEIWFWWRTSKDWEGKVSSYFNYKLEIDAHCVYIQNVEVVHQGKKLNVQKGEIEIFFRPKLITDPGNKWENSKFMKQLKPIYERMILGREIEKRERELWKDVYRIHAKVKQYLQLKNFMAVPEPAFARTYGHEE